MKITLEKLEMILECRQAGLADALFEREVAGHNEKRLEELDANVIYAQAALENFWADYGEDYSRLTEASIIKETN